MQSIDVFLDFMYLISYICQMKATDKKDSGIRELYFSDEFTEFYAKDYSKQIKVAKQILEDFEL